MRIQGPTVRGLPLAPIHISRSRVARSSRGTCYEYNYRLDAPQTPLSSCHERTADDDFELGTASQLGDRPVLVVKADEEITGAQKRPITKVATRPLARGPVLDKAAAHVLRFPFPLVVPRTPSAGVRAFRHFSRPTRSSRWSEDGQTLLESEMELLAPAGCGILPPSASKAVCDKLLSPGRTSNEVTVAKL